jgi:hypothetical protein
MPILAPLQYLSGRNLPLFCQGDSSVVLEIMAARVGLIQQAIAAGQNTPIGNLIELNSRVQRGSLLAIFELAHKRHQAKLMDGSGRRA